MSDMKLEGLIPRLGDKLQVATPRQPRGRLKRIRGLMVHASISSVAIGELCHLRDPVTGRRIPAEVVGFEEDEALLSPLGDVEGLSNRIEVIPTGSSAKIRVGDGLLGRVISPFGDLLDHGSSIEISSLETLQPIHATPPLPMSRSIIERPITLGIRSIDGLNTVAQGQRIGLFGGPGAGKSSLLSSIVNGSDADVVVLGLVGERGREVKELLDVQLNKEARQKTVCVVATSDRPALERTRAAYTATAIAEYFRDREQHVLLLMDSLTRFARAQREIGLAAGEPPTRRGYPPSVFSILPRLLERAGPGERGTITAIYTILTEGDDSSDPIAEESKAILDGHIVLSQELAGRNHFPAVDILASRSRLMHHIVSIEHGNLADRIRDLMSRYNDIELLIQVGEYKEGENSNNDMAVERQADIEAFLRQPLSELERPSLAETISRMEALLK